ncbi:DUF1659 domain-containing protein [Clostridium sp. MT-14]|uniref:DUF1659 domain-containing protein n=1 Tax=Clostridium aromativorans TaxID=2836848 RepID=A0ABS8N945_9CLOT|nr:MULTISPECIES: DUF1659 domain-containing protein [Clostridium]KAA8671565.1 DUF1659 domain-containing protein [Clostridium sp. HV4-5-A1G]MCC9296337.1 DUF1659 domain-containing protein [Clostridium aromativorans]
MAAKTTLLNTSVILKYKDGLDEEGKDIIKRQTFSNIKIDAAVQDIYDVAGEIEKLLGKTLEELIRQDESGITNA